MDIAEYIGMIKLFDPLLMSEGEKSLELSTVEVRCVLLGMETLVTTL